MKKFIKNNLFGFLIGILLCSGIVYGVNTYDSNSIEYSPTDASWEVNNVSEAINSLYNNVTELENIKSIGDAEASDIAEGKTALVNGNIVTGTLKIENKQMLEIETLSKKGGWNDTATYTGECGTLKGTGNGATFTATIDCTIKAYFAMSYSGSFINSYITTSNGCEIIQKMIDANNIREYIIKVPKGEIVTMHAAGYDYTTYSMGVLCSKSFN